MRAWRTAARHLAHADPPRRVCFYSRALQTQASIAELLNQDGADADVVVNAWVRSVRKQKRVAFAALRDGSTTEPLQAVLTPQQAEDLRHGTAVELAGRWVPSTGSGQKRELHVSSVRVLGENDAESNPIQPKYHTQDFLRSVPHLRPRVPSNALLLRLRSDVIASLTNFFHKEGFVQTHTPIITSSDCEGAGDVFTVSSNASKDSSQKGKPEGHAKDEHFFRTPNYLTVSSQLHLEALAQALTKVWTLSPTFRAEKSDTPRHLAEFYMLETEVCFVEDLGGVMSLVERTLQAVATELRTSRVGGEILRAKHSAAKENEDRHVSAETLQARWDGMAAANWPRITYAEAIRMLEEAAESQHIRLTFEPSYANGLQAEHERYLAATVGNGTPVFVTDYPRAQKPFYMPPSTSTANSKGTDDTVACFDLLVPDLCELVGGSMREHRFRELTQAMQAKGVAGDRLEWYQELRRYGSVAHGGFGLGFDRLLCYLSGVGNVRDVVAFPRWSELVEIRESGTDGSICAAAKAPGHSNSTNLGCRRRSSTACLRLRFITSLSERRYMSAVRPAAVDSVVAHSGHMAAHDAIVPEPDEYDYESLPPNFSLAANMAAGAFAGIAEHSVMYPIDLLKTRMQVVNPTPAAIYTGLGNAITTISRAEGYLSLWRGLSSVVVGAGPAHAVYFATYEFVKQAMGGNASGHHPLAAATSGACATIASDAFMNPFDVIKQRMQVHGSTYRSISECARSVFRNEGVRAFYISYPTTLTMTVPFTALQFTAYESLTKAMQRRRRPGYDPLTHCTAGGLAGGFAAAATTPLDVVKTLLQTRGTSTDVEIRRANGLFQAAAIIWRREGAKGFFRGMKARVVTAAPSTAICWSAYEVAKAYFIRKEEEK